MSKKKVIFLICGENKCFCKSKWVEIKSVKNEMLEKARQIIDNLEVDIVCCNKHRQKLKHKQNRNGFRQMFNGGETDPMATATHNIHENVGKYQEGGMAMLVLVSQ